MHYLGFDCHKRNHTFALLDCTGAILRRGTVTNSLHELRKLADEMPSDLQVGLEGPTALRGAIRLAFDHVPCYEICPAWTHERRRQGRPKPKNDHHDALRVARLLAEEVHSLVPLPRASEQRQALTVLLKLDRGISKDLHACAQRIQEIITMLWHGAAKSLFKKNLAKTARCFFRRYPHPSRAARATSLGRSLAKWSRGRFGNDLANVIRAVAKTFGDPTLADEFLCAELQRLLDDYESLLQRRAQTQELIRKTLEDLDLSWLLDQPGLGVVRAATLVDSGFLESPGDDSFAKLAGLAPEEDASGERGHFRNSPRRRKPLFTVLLDWANWLAMPRSGVPEAAAYYQRKRLEGKTRCTALRCLARRQLRPLFALRRQHLSCSRNAVRHSEVEAA